MQEEQSPPTGQTVLLVAMLIIGLNVMETSVFAFIVTTGMIDGGAPPLVAAGDPGPFASPLPHALVLTGIVVAVSVTSLALVLILRVRAEFGSVELDEPSGRRGSVDD